MENNKKTSKTTSQSERKQAVSLILLIDGKTLVEKRHANKKTSPNAIIFPGGHVEANESKEEAIRREMQEELNITLPNETKMVFETDFGCEEKQHITWFYATAYEGFLQKKEAKELIWIDTKKETALTHEISRTALKNALIQNEFGQSKKFNLNR